MKEESTQSTGCVDFRTAKQDKRPRKGWWAPGHYLNQCRLCGCGFIGDRRAGHCADCEYNAGIDGQEGGEELAIRLSTMRE